MGDDTTQGNQGPEPEHNPPRPNLRARLEEFERMLRERVHEAEDKVRAGIKSAVPEKAFEHLANSKKEFLLFARGVIDAELGKGEAKSPEEATPKAGEKNQ